MSIDQGKPVILVLLDLSATFDTVDHNVLFSRLKEMFGLSGRVLEWFRILSGTSTSLYHLHADDTQLSISLDPDNQLNFSSPLKNLKHCIADIRLWATQNLLILNDNKLICHIFVITTWC